MGIQERVAARALLASYFNVGEPILFGKYKNKKGIIRRLFLDEKGHPAMEVEPVPKGRKKNKIIGLFKVWHAPSPKVASMVSFDMVEEGEDDDD